MANFKIKLLLNYSFMPKRYLMTSSFVIKGIVWISTVIKSNFFMHIECIFKSEEKLPKGLIVKLIKISSKSKAFKKK